MKRNLKSIIGGMLATASLLTLTACTAPVSEASDAPEAGGDTTVYKVGIVQFVDDASLNQIEANIEKQLDAKGAELGVNFLYEGYVYNGQADATTLNQIASELIAEEVDIIIPIATPAAQIMQSATEDYDIPIVFSAVSDPVVAGLVDSLEAPGGNITGTSDSLNTKAVIDLILATKPDTDYVGLLYSKSEDSSRKPIEDAKIYLDSLNIKYIEKTGTTTDEVISASDALIAEGVDAVFTPTDNTVMKAQLAIYEKFAEARIPQFCGADSFALNGALLGYGVDYANLGKLTADMAVAVLTGEEETATYGVMTFDNGIATVNTEIAAEMGIDLEAMKAAIADLCSAIIEIETAEEFD